MDAGRNCGITGDIDIKVTGSETIKYSMRVYRFEATGSAQAFNSTGQGSAGIANDIGGPESGGLILTGKIRTDGAPLPTNIRYALATIKLTMNGKTGGTMQVRIQSYKIDYSEGPQQKGTGGAQGDTFWGLTLICTRVGGLALSAFGTNPVTPSTPAALSNTYLYEGRMKVIDPNILTDESQRVFVMWGLSADTDAAELSAAATTLALYAAPQSGEVVHHSQVTRLDDFTARLTTTWKNRTTVQDVTFPESFQRLDLYKIESVAASAVVFNTSAGMPAPSTAPAGLQNTSVRVAQLTNQKSKLLTESEINNSWQKIEFPHSPRRIDPYLLESNVTSSIVNYIASGAPAAPTPGVGLQIVSVETVKKTPILQETLYGMEPNNSWQKIEFPHSPRKIDPFYFESFVTSAVVNYIASGSPTSPTPPAGLQIVSVDTIKKTPLLQETIFGMAVNNSVQKRTYPRMYSTRSGIQPWIDKIAAIITSSATDQTEATTQWNAFQSGANIANIRVSSESDGKKLIVFEYIDPGIQVSGMEAGGAREVYARVNSGNIQVFVNSSYDIGNGMRWVVLSPVKLQSHPIRRLLYQRFQQGSTIDSFINPSQLGTVNNATFDGLAAGTVLYQDALFTTNETLSGTRPFFLGYVLRVDSNGIIDTIPMHFFNPNGVPLTTSDTTQGDWVNVSDFTELASSFVAPSSSDLGFINS